MTAEPAPQKSSGISGEAFGQFLEWLSPDHETAAKLYLEIRRKLVQLFIRRGCSHPDDLADITLDRAAMIVFKQRERYANPQALCFGVARKVWLEYLRETKPVPLETDNVAVHDGQDSHVRESEAKCLGCCIERLRPQERELIVRYHQFRGRAKIERRQQMAEQYGGLNKLRISAHRIRLRLNDCISGCMQQVSESLLHG